MTDTEPNHGVLRIYVLLDRVENNSFVLPGNLVEPLPLLGHDSRKAERPANPGLRGGSARAR